MIRTGSNKQDLITNNLTTTNNSPIRENQQDNERELVQHANQCEVNSSLFPLNPLSQTCFFIICINSSGLRASKLFSMN